MRISILVPALNEEDRIAAHLEQLRREQPHQLIVVDGGSEDATQERAQAADQLLHAAGGLACQLNLAAEHADGDVLLVAYADTTLPAGWSAAIGRALTDEAQVAGAFRLSLDDSRWRYRITAAAANLRSSIGLGPFGDQALFMRRAAFEQVGGYDPKALLEDLDLIRRLRRVGRVRVLQPAVVSSVRRWESRGFLSTAARNWAYLGCHLLGIGGGLARRRYQSHRSGG